MIQSASWTASERNCVRTSSVRPRSTMLSGARSRATSARVRRSTSIDARSMVSGFKSKIATGHPADAHNAAQPTPMSPAPITATFCKVAVIGAGDIGVGWAALCASAGWPVAIFDLNPETMERAWIEVERRTRALVALDRAPESIVERGLTELVRAQFLSEAVQDADWIIEAIHEDVTAKQKLLAGIEQQAGDDALISSSSSGLPPTEIFGRMRRLDRCLVTHPLNPPELIPLVEVVPAEGRTSAASMNRAVEYLRSLGRFPIVLKKSVPGYVVGRVSAAVWRECIDLVLR